MDSIAETMNAVLRRKSSVPPPAHVPRADEIMMRRLVTLRPEQTLGQVIETLLGKRVSGAPVVDAEGELVGMISQMDCIKVVAAGSYHDEPLDQQALASTIMTQVLRTIEPSTDIYRIARIFLEGQVRRLPVVTDGRLLGQVSPRDVLRSALESLR